MLMAIANNESMQYVNEEIADSARNRELRIVTSSRTNFDINNQENIPPSEKAPPGLYNEKSQPWPVIKVVTRSTTNKTTCLIDENKQVDCNKALISEVKNNNNEQMMETNDIGMSGSSGCSPQDIDGGPYDARSNDGNNNYNNNNSISENDMFTEPSMGSGVNEEQAFRQALFDEYLSNDKWVDKYLPYAHLYDLATFKRRVSLFSLRDDLSFDLPQQSVLEDAEGETDSDAYQQLELIWEPDAMSCNRLRERLYEQARMTLVCASSLLQAPEYENEDFSSCFEKLKSHFVSTVCRLLPPVTFGGSRHSKISWMIDEKDHLCFNDFATGKEHLMSLIDKVESESAEVNGDIRSFSILQNRGINAYIDSDIYGKTDMLVVKDNNNNNSTNIIPQSEKSNRNRLPDVSCLKRILTNKKLSSKEETHLMQMLYYDTEDATHKWPNTFRYASNLSDKLCLTKYLPWWPCFAEDNPVDRNNVRCDLLYQSKGDVKVDKAALRRAEPLTYYRSSRRKRRRFDLSLEEEDFMAVENSEILEDWKMNRRRLPQDDINEEDDYDYDDGDCYGKAKKRSMILSRLYLHHDDPFMAAEMSSISSACCYTSDEELTEKDEIVKASMEIQRRLDDEAFRSVNDVPDNATAFLHVVDDSLTIEACEASSDWMYCPDGITHSAVLRRATELRHLTDMRRTKPSTRGIRKKKVTYEDSKAGAAARLRSAFLQQRQIYHSSTLSREELNESDHLLYSQTERILTRRQMEPRSTRKDTLRNGSGDLFSGFSISSLSPEEQAHYHQMVAEREKRRQELQKQHQQHLDLQRKQLEERLANTKITDGTPPPFFRRGRGRPRKFVPGTTSSSRILISEIKDPNIKLWCSIAGRHDNLPCLPPSFMEGQNENRDEDIARIAAITAGKQDIRPNARPDSALGTCTNTETAHREFLAATSYASNRMTGDAGTGVTISGTTVEKGEGESPPISPSKKTDGDQTPKIRGPYRTKRRIQEMAEFAAQHRLNRSMEADYKTIFQDGEAMQINYPASDNSDHSSQHHNRSASLGHQFPVSEKTTSLLPHQALEGYSLLDHNNDAMHHGKNKNFNIPTNRKLVNIPSTHHNTSNRPTFCPSLNPVRMNPEHLDYPQRTPSDSKFKIQKITLASATREDEHV